MSSNIKAWHLPWPLGCLDENLDESLKVWVMILGKCCKDFVFLREELLPSKKRSHQYLAEVWKGLKGLREKPLRKPAPPPMPREWGKERSSSGRHLKHRAEFQAGPSFTLRGADECRHRGLRAGQFWSTSLRSILKKWSLKVWSMRQGAGPPSSMAVL